MKDLERKETVNRFREILELVANFSDKHLNEKLFDYAVNLCEMLAMRDELPITRGKKEVWAAAAIHIIARYNFLFDPSSDCYIRSDTITDFFSIGKSTASNKAREIEEAYDIDFDTKGICDPEIDEARTLVELPNGLVTTLRMLKRINAESEQTEEEKEAREKEREENLRLYWKKKQAKSEEIKQKKLQEKKNTEKKYQDGLFEDW